MGDRYEESDQARAEAQKWCDDEEGFEAKAVAEAAHKALEDGFADEKCDQEEADCGFTESPLVAQVDRHGRDVEDGVAKLGGQCHGDNEGGCGARAGGCRLHRLHRLHYEAGICFEWMRIESMGDRAVVLYDLPFPPAVVARAVEGMAGVDDAVPASDCVGVYFGEVFATESLRGLVFDEATFEPRTHEVPVCYDLGDDLEHVAAGLRIAPDQVVLLHTSQTWPCFAIGFCPGFAYLGPVCEALRGVPRLASPRTKTEPGSVGLTGEQTAVYPLERPGGWPIIGRTPLQLVDVDERYFPITVGDLVRFIPIDQAEYRHLRGKRL